MGIFSWLVIGLVAGYIGSKLVNRTGEGLMRDLLLGVIGAIVGGAVFHALGYVGVTGVNLRSILVAVVGSVIVLVTYHAVTGQQAARSAWWRSLSRPAKIDLSPETFARPCALYRKSPRPIHNISNDPGMRSRLGYAPARALPAG